ncbi:stage II sporulation protein M [Sporolactobacillus shoreae]|uniref:Stage II sporulation protein M n=1 Tax=Sporolactobacillus shoreae TaxID=1465501 RepID=A0A4Z0GJR2_9BACL|nr:stage II sporulation protein M [Sporolactobacillus shoreae]TGA97059.1 stage II sporulation protein M [Sporolactobacillus shoreae]
MIDRIKSIYQDTYLQNVKVFLVGWIIFIFTAVVTAIVCGMLHVDLISILKDLNNNFPSYHSQFSSFIGIFLNNIKTCLQILIFSLIPILFFPWISIIFNGAVIGVVAYLIVAIHKNLFKMILLGLLPHGVIEISMFILCACFTIKIQRLWIDKIKNIFRSKLKKKPVDRLWIYYKQTFEQFVLIIIPGIAVAAFIEAFITSYLLDHFM